jgi:hypothetical protein
MYIANYRRVRQLLSTLQPGHKAGHDHRYSPDQIGTGDHVSYPTGNEVPGVIAHTNGPHTPSLYLTLQETGRLAHNPVMQYFQLLVAILPSSQVPGLAIHLGHPNPRLAPGHLSLQSRPAHTFLRGRQRGP